MTVSFEQIILTKRLLELKCENLIIQHQMLAEVKTYFLVFPEPVMTPSIACYIMLMILSFLF